jgi:hypothetical protein
LQQTGEKTLPPKLYMWSRWYERKACINSSQNCLFLYSLLFYSEDGSISLWNVGKYPSIYQTICDHISEHSNILIKLACSSYELQNYVLKHIRYLFQTELIYSMGTNHMTAVVLVITIILLLSMYYMIMMTTYIAWKNSSQTYCIYLSLIVLVIFIGVNWSLLNDACCNTLFNNPAECMCVCVTLCHNILKR